MYYEVYYNHLTKRITKNAMLNEMDTTIMWYPCAFRNDLATLFVQVSAEDQS